MEHTGRVWFGEDDPSLAVRATVGVSSDKRLTVFVGESLVADWALADVDFAVDDLTTELQAGDDCLMFDPDDREAWVNEMTAVQFRTRLQGGEQKPGDAADDQPAAVNEDPAVADLSAGGGAVLMTGSYCRACGEPIDPRAEICVHCGVRQRALVVRPRKSRTTAGLLALFLGGLGVHHFYLGQTGLGILYLLFFWTFIPAMVAFVEALVFFFSSDASFDAKYNTI